MIPEEHFVVGGVASAVIALVGTVFNAIRSLPDFQLFKTQILKEPQCSSLVVLCGDARLRSNPTTLLVIFLSTSNLIHTSLVLPLNALAMLKPE